MFARDVHVLLAILTLLAAVWATSEGVIRFVRKLPSGRAAARSKTAVVIATAMTAAAGLALLLSGKHPGEWIHLIYAAFAFSLIPFADNATMTIQSNRGKALARVGGGLTCLIVIARLFATG